MTGRSAARTTVGEPRITDLTAVGPENSNRRNQAVLEDDSPYDVLTLQRRFELRDRIWSVRNGDLQCVLEDFPTDEPLVEQCALWTRAIVDRHFFPAANHRTAFALLRQLLEENGIEPEDWSAERTEQARAESQRVRDEIPPVGLDTLYERDALYDVWRRNFEDVLAGSDRVG